MRILIEILHERSVFTHFQLRAVAPSIGGKNEHTAVFIFADGEEHSECEGTYKWSAGDTVAEFVWIDIDSKFKGLTILHQPVEEEYIE